MNAEMFNRLKMPFSYDEVEARILYVHSNNTKAYAVYYIRSRAIQDRLDDVVGPDKWVNCYSQWQSNAQLCGISIYDKERDKWITKYDGAPNTKVEPVKGGLSDSLKRAACVWGIGRYLYKVGGVHVEIEKIGNTEKDFRIKSNQQPILRKAYESAVTKLFGPAAFQQATANNTGNAADVSGNQRRKTKPPADKPPAQSKVATMPETPPKQPKTDAPPAQSKVAATPATPPVQPKPAAVAEAPPAQPSPSAQSAHPPASTPPPAQDAIDNPPVTAPAYEYVVHSAKSGGKEGILLLELVDINGELTSAFINTGGISIEAGAYLRNVTIEDRKTGFREYKVITRYEIVPAEMLLAAA